MKDTGPESVVRSFFAAWETDGFVPAFERYMAPHATWHNTGFPACTGREAYMALLREYLRFSQMPFGRVEIRSLAVDGNKVLTERIDHLFDAAGTRAHSAAIMGTLEVENGLIVRYADYFDAGQFKDMAAASR